MDNINCFKIDKKYHKMKTRIDIRKENEKQTKWEFRVN